LASFDRAIALDPVFVPAWFHKSHSLLLNGDWDQGWALQEWRRKLPGARNLNFRQPEWTGKENIAGKTLFIWWEEGLGDAIMLFRYAVLARARGAQVIFSASDSLTRLLRQAGGGVEIVGADAEPQDFDYHIPLFSLPRAFGMTAESIPCASSWLSAEPALTAQWRERIGAHGFRIGIVWAATKTRALGRSFALRELEGLARLPGVRLISLQKHDGVAELESLPPGMGVEIPGPIDEGGDGFVDTAAIMENLDLVISADTAAAHLAGALGRPVWLALQFAADWRWGLSRQDSPWYPSMRLFRQASPGDWSGVFAGIKSALAQKIQGGLPEIRR
jgi:hypothetical protein